MLKDIPMVQNTPDNVGKPPVVLVKTWLAMYKGKCIYTYESERCVITRFWIVRVCRKICIK